MRYTVTYTKITMLLILYSYAAIKPVGVEHVENLSCHQLCIPPRLKLYWLGQLSESFEIWSAINRINTEGKSVIMKWGLCCLSSKTNKIKRE